MTDDLEREVRAAIEPELMRLFGDDLISGRAGLLASVVVRLIEEERAPLAAELARAMDLIADKEVENGNLMADLSDANAAVARVRALHFEYRGPTDPDSCAHCNQISDGMEIRYPCPTIAALDGPSECLRLDCDCSFPHNVGECDGTETTR